MLGQILPNDESLKISFVEITRIPQSYTIERYTIPNSDQDNYSSNSLIPLKFQRFLGAVMHSNQVMGFRIQTSHGVSRFLYLTSSDMQNIVTSSFIPQFPDFELSVNPDNTDLELTGQLHIAEIRGVPLSVRFPLDGLIETMSRSGGNSLYQVWISPKKPGYISRKMAEKKYKSVLEKTQSQETIGGWLGSNDSRTHYDVGAMSSVEWYRSAYERASADRLLECRVILAFWGHQTSVSTLEMALNTLLATISHTSKREKMTTKTHSGHHAYSVLIDALSLGNRTKGTPLLPKEAIPFFEIPGITLDEKVSLEMQLGKDSVM